MDGEIRAALDGLRDLLTHAIGAPVAPLDEAGKERLARALLTDPNPVAVYGGADGGRATCDEVFPPTEEDVPMPERYEWAECNPPAED